MPTQSTANASPTNPVLSPWLEQMASLPPGKTLPSPQDLYDPNRATLLIKQGHPVDRSLLEKLIQFGVQPSSPEVSTGQKRMILPHGLQMPAPAEPTAWSRRLERKVLVVEPDVRSCRKILAQLMAGQVVAPQRLVTVPAVSLLERAIRQLHPTDLVLSWTLRDETAEAALWQTLKTLHQQHRHLNVVVTATVDPACRNRLDDWQERASHTRANFLLKPLKLGELATIMNECTLY